MIAPIRRSQLIGRQFLTRNGQTATMGRAPPGAATHGIYRSFATCCESAGGARASAASPASRERTCPRSFAISGGVSGHIKLTH